MNRTSKDSVRRSLRGWTAVWAVLGLMLVGQVHASDADAVDAAPGALYTVHVDLVGVEWAMNLDDDNGARLEDGSMLGVWNFDGESDDFTVSSDAFTLILTEMAQSGEGGTGSATLVDILGNEIHGVWALQDIHPVEIAGAAYSIDALEDFFLIGNFTSDESSGIEKSIAVGEGNFLEVHFVSGVDVIELPAGAEVFIGDGVSAPNALLFQDPQKKKGRLEPRRPKPQQAPPSAPRLYAAGAWTRITYPKGTCITVTPTGGHCGAGGASCKIGVEFRIPNGRIVTLGHHGPCSKPGNTYTVNPTGSLWVNY